MRLERRAAQVYVRGCGQRERRIERTDACEVRCKSYTPVLIGRARASKGSKIAVAETKGLIASLRSKQSVVRRAW